jgi:hypothetical protein
MPNRLYKLLSSFASGMSNGPTRFFPDNLKVGNGGLTSYQALPLAITASCPGRLLYTGS